MVFLLACSSFDTASSFKLSSLARFATSAEQVEEKRSSQRSGHNTDWYLFWCDQGASQQIYQHQIDGSSQGNEWQEAAMVGSDEQAGDMGNH